MKKEKMRVVPVSSPPPGAFAALMALCEGNGVEPGQFREDGVEARNIVLPGRIAVTLTPDISSGGRRPGPAPQGAFPARAAAESEIERMSKDWAVDPAVRRDVSAFLEARPGHGWGLRDDRAILSAGRREVCVVQACTDCGGAGAAACPDCRGSGAIACQFCYGQGCDKCGGRKTSPCAQCAAQGRLPCRPCGASGQIVDILRVACRAAFHFEGGAATDADAQAAIAALGVGRLVVDGHVSVKPGAPTVAGDLVSFPLEALLPIETISLRVMGKPQTAVVAGLHRRLVRAEPFLDLFIKPGVNALVRLTRGGFAMRALLATASKYKIVRRALVLAGDHSKTHVWKTLARDYPFVLSDKYARALAQYAAAALLILARAPRRRGLVAGTVLSAAFAGLYFPAGGRAVALEALTTLGYGHLALFADAGACLLTGLLTILLIKMFARDAIARLLRFGAGRKPPLQHAGAEGWMVIPMTLLVWGGAFILARHPEWIAAARVFLKID